MSAQHHPSDETLLRVAAGNLPAGPSVVVRAHMDGCAICRARLTTFEAVGGALLQQLPPVPLRADSLERALARVDSEVSSDENSNERRPRRSSASNARDIVLPRSLQSYTIGPWRWLGPGIRRSRIALPESPDANVMLLRIGANRKLPEHGHTGTEFTLVIAGSYSDAAGRYLPGDLTEADASVEHQPVVDPDGECICLAATEGQMRLVGFFGRLMQPFIRL